jgi:type I restriction enzyme S subunit
LADPRVQSEIFSKTDIPSIHRETDIEPVPENWKTVSLGTLAQLRKESIHPGEALHLPYVGLEHINSGDTSLSRWGEASSVKSGKSHFYSGDVLYGKLRPYLDKAVLAKREGICSTDILVLSPEEGVDPTFLSYLLHVRCFTAHAVATTTGVNHPRTSWSSIREFKTILPPFPEQQAIAHVLSTIQKAIETTEKVIETSHELKRSLMTHLFTYGPVSVDEAERVPLKETEIGSVPEHWGVVELGEITRSRFKNGIFVKGAKWGTGTRYLNVADVYSNSVVDPRMLRLLEVPSEKQIGFEVQQGDIVFVRSSLKREGIARACMVPDIQEKVIFDCHLIKVVPEHTAVHPRYLVEYCRSRRGHSRLIALSKTTTMTTIPQPNLAQFQLPLPPLPEQEKIAKTLATVDQKIKVEESRKASLGVIFNSFLHNLMTGKIRANDLDMSAVEEIV